MAKKKILLLSDDLRMASGIATVSKELVLGTAHKYDWFQVGAAINHPEAGKILDVNFYGEMADSINAGDASDRILVEWDISDNPAEETLKNPVEVEIPADIVALRRSDIESARSWRKRVRNALLPKLDAGWRIVDFQRGSTSLPRYILSEG